MNMPELDDFATDVRLVFSNAMLFNKNEQHQVHIAARKLSTFFELKYEELKLGHQREKRDAPGRRGPASSQASWGLRVAASRGLPGAGDDARRF